MTTAIGNDQDHVQEYIERIGTNYVRHHPAEKGGVYEPEQVATLKPMAPDETSQPGP